MSVLPVRTVSELLASEASRHARSYTVLEAGSGRFRHFDYPGTALITGLDVSRDQLEHNDYAHEKIHGDVQTWSTDRHWDAVVSVFVLEHVEHPRRAVANMLSWTRPGGLLVIAVPNALSLKGLVTKATPFWFHEWFYRHVYRRPYAIFPTIMKMSIAPRSLRRQLAGHEIVYETYSQESLGQPFRVLYAAMIRALRIVTFGRWRPENSNYLLVVRRIDAPGDVHAATSAGKDL